jgi:prepilin-type N-terminal cleavage/methylation domain-containing protein/prepilin-type processing-associated H-X9-DG protein
MMFSCAARRRARITRGFTLIELLVVIAIIAILAAILFPVFSKVREKANQNKCLNNQRQLAIGLMMYAQDNEETFPLPSEWVAAVNLSSDPKVFDCPTTSRDGGPGQPDYGMNAFLFDLNPRTGQISGAALGNLDDPTIIELTTDSKGVQTGLASTDADPERAAVIDQFSNPFPKSYTITGFGGTGDPRHSGGAICSYADGHVKLVSAVELGGNPSGYAIPRGSGRMYLDMSQVQDYDDAARRIYSIFRNTPYNYDDNGLTNGTISAPSGVPTNDAGIAGGTWNITGPGAMHLYGGGSAPYANFLGVGGTVSLMMEAEVSSDCIFTFGNINIRIESVPVPPVGNDERLAMQKAILFNAASGYVQGGSTKAWSGYAYADYTPFDWIDLPSTERGERTDIPSVSSIRLELKMVQGGYWPLWPTGRRWVYTAGGNPEGDFTAQCPIVGHTEWKLTGPNTHVSYSGPYILYGWAPNWSKYLDVYQGQLKIKKIMVN